MDAAFVYAVTRAASCLMRDLFVLQLEPLLRKLTKGPVLHTIATLSRRVSSANAIDRVYTGGTFARYNEACDRHANPTE